MLFLVLFFCFWRPFKLILLFLTTFLFEFSICQQLSFYDLHSILTLVIIFCSAMSFCFLTIFFISRLNTTDFYFFLSFFFICFTYNIFIFSLSLLLYLFALFSLNCTNFGSFLSLKIDSFLKTSFVYSFVLSYIYPKTSFLLHTSKIFPHFLHLLKNISTTQK